MTWLYLSALAAFVLLGIACGVYVLALALMEDDRQLNEED